MSATLQAASVQSYAHTCPEVTLQFVDYTKSSYIHSCSSHTTQHVTSFHHSSRHRTGISI